MLTRVTCLQLTLAMGVKPSSKSPTLRARTIRAAAVYEIEFNIAFIKQTDQQRYSDLESKVVELVHFLRDYARHGKNPIVADSVFHNLVELKKLSANMVSDYLRWFFSSEIGAFLVSGQLEPTYDPFCDAFLRNVVDGRTVSQCSSVLLSTASTPTTIKAKPRFGI